MDRDKRFDLYRRAIDAWGANAQVAVAGEELSELYRALSRMETPSRYSEENLVEELADAFIVCEQLMVIYEVEDLVVAQLCRWMDDEVEARPVQFRRALARLMALLCDHYDRGHIDPRDLQRLLVEVYYSIGDFQDGMELTDKVFDVMDKKLARLAARLERATKKQL